MSNNKYVVFKNTIFDYIKLGNYMFIYATLYNISINNNAKIYVNSNDFKEIFSNVTYKKIFQSCNYFENENNFENIPFFNGMKIVGNFLNIKYFNSNKIQLKEAFKLNIKYNKKILSQEYLDEYVFVYIGITEMKYLNIVDNDYYVNAINKIGSTYKFLFFVNDILKDNYLNIIKELKNINSYEVYYFNNKEIPYLFSLFLQIKKAIIPNSLFLWWAIYLSYDSKDTIIVPENWFTKEKSLIDKNYLMLKKFIRINNKINDEEIFLNNYIIKDNNFYKNKCIKAYLIPEDGIGSNMFTIATAYSLAKDNKCNFVVSDEIPHHIDKNSTLPLSICQLFPNINCIDNNIFYPYRFTEQYPSNKLQK